MLLVADKYKSVDNSNEYVTGSPITILKMDINTNLRMKTVIKII